MGSLSTTGGHESMHRAGSHPVPFLGVFRQTVLTVGLDPKKGGSGERKLAASVEMVVHIVQEGRERKLRSTKMMVTGRKVEKLLGLIEKKNLDLGLLMQFSAFRIVTNYHHDDHHPLSGLSR